MMSERCKRLGACMLRYRQQVLGGNTGKGSGMSSRVSPSLTHKHITMAEIDEGIVMPLDKGPLGLEMPPYLSEGLESPEDSLSNDSVNSGQIMGQMGMPQVESHLDMPMLLRPKLEQMEHVEEASSEDLEGEEIPKSLESPSRAFGSGRHRVPGKYKCQLCGTTFAKPARLTQHMQTHSEEVRLRPPLILAFDDSPTPTNQSNSIQRPFACTWEGCTNAFKRKTHLNRHMMLHKQEFPFGCDWEGCSRAFVQKCQLEKHQLIHTTPKPWVCTWEGCGEAFSKHNKLRRHLCTHTGDSPYPCPTEGCEQGFDHPSHLARHVRSVHNSTFFVFQSASFFFCV